MNLKYSVGLDVSGKKINACTLIVVCRYNFKKLAEQRINSAMALRQCLYEKLKTQ